MHAELPDRNSGSGWPRGAPGSGAGCRALPPPGPHTSPPPPARPGARLGQDAVLGPSVLRLRAPARALGSWPSLMRGSLFLYVHYRVFCGSYNKFIIPVFVMNLSLCLPTPPTPREPGALCPVRGAVGAERGPPLWTGDAQTPWGWEDCPARQGSEPKLSVWQTRVSCGHCRAGQHPGGDLAPQPWPQPLVEEGGPGRAAHQLSVPVHTGRGLARVPGRQPPAPWEERAGGV
jgi:hypothetical protein